MHRRIVRRAAAVLLVVSVAGAAAMLAGLIPADPYAAAADAVPAAAGVVLWRGSPRAAQWVRAAAVFLLAAVIAAAVLAPFYQPLDLTLTEIRLHPATFAAGAAAVVFVAGLLAWTSRELGRAPVLDAIDGAGGSRWDMRMPARAGAGVAGLAGLLLWLALHGQSADLATTLALQQLGPDYRYHLTWISRAGNGRGTTVTGVVTAWNDKEIKEVLLHWQTR